MSTDECVCVCVCVMAAIQNVGVVCGGGMHPHLIGGECDKLGLQGVLLEALIPCTKVEGLTKMEGPVEEGERDSQGF